MQVVKVFGNTWIVVQTNCGHCMETLLGMILSVKDSVATGTLWIVMMIFLCTIGI
jgi:hypothetical protein